jgi:PmbA protein
MKQLDETIEFLKDRLDETTADEYEIYAESVRGLSVESKDGRVETFTRSDELGASVRLVKDGRACMSSSSDLSPDPLASMVADAEAALAEVDSSDEACVAPPQRGVAVLAERPGVPFDSVDESEKIAVAKRLERAVLESGSQIACARQPCYSETTRTVGVATSSGIDERAQRSFISCDVQAVAERGGASETAWESEHYVRFEDVDVEGMGRRAGERAAERLGAASMTTGRRRVYFEPRAAAALLRILMPSFFAHNIQRGSSRLAGKLKREMFGSGVSIFDDGLLPGGLASFPFDCEGVWHQRTAVVGEGVVEGWLYDAASARREDVRSTGNASRRSIHSLPQTEVTNCFIGKGSGAPADLIASCEGGMWVSELMGLHTANTISGDFSLGAVGFSVKDAGKGDPVRGVVLAGNVFDVFRDADGVGDNLRFFGRYGAPSITVPDIQVNGS